MRVLRTYGLLFISLIVAACDDAIIDPFKNDGKYFTIYGYLDALELTHEVRVIPVTRRITKFTTPENPQSQLDAKVRSINLATQETIEWRHTLEPLDDETYAHIFRASFVVSPGFTYRLEVERSDGIVAYAETRVPIIFTEELFENGPVKFSADSTEVTQDIYIPEINSPWNIEAFYLWGTGQNNQRTFVPYGRSGERAPDGGWNLTVQVSEDQIYVREDMDDASERFENPPPRILITMGLQLRILDENWDPPEGVFNPETLADPEQITNVVNGFGFWGSIGYYRQEWIICDLSGPLGYIPIPDGC